MGIKIIGISIFSTCTDIFSVQVLIFFSTCTDIFSVQVLTLFSTCTDIFQYMYWHFQYMLYSSDWWRTASCPVPEPLNMEEFGTDDYYTSNLSSTHIYYTTLCSSSYTLSTIAGLSHILKDRTISVLQLDINFHWWT